MELLTESIGRAETALMELEGMTSTALDLMTVQQMSQLIALRISLKSDLTIAKINIEEKICTELYPSIEELISERLSEATAFYQEVYDTYPEWGVSRVNS